MVVNLVQPEPATAGGARAGGRKSKKTKPAAIVGVLEPEDVEEEWKEDEDEYELTDADEEDWEEEEEEEEEWEEEEKRMRTSRLPQPNRQRWKKYVNG